MDLLERARALAASPLLAALAPSALVRLAARATARELAAGEACPTGRSVWIVAAGRLGVEGVPGAPGGVGGQAVEAGPGAAIGLVGVLAPRPAAGVRALAPSRVLVLHADDVRDLLEEDPSAMASVVGALAALLRGDDA